MISEVSRFVQDIDGIIACRLLRNSNTRSFAAAKFVPKLLLMEQKELLAVVQDLLDTINSEPGFLQLLTVSEKENAIKKILFQIREEIKQNA
ncbi:hypothetical protein TNCV_2781491 [Trichonephila clavipes]|nr:hypothetical protein TNCV_2781491 [Trichonephila clavipes]